MVKTFYILLASFLFTFTLFAQNKTKPQWYFTESNGGLCNQSLLLFDDSTWCAESGCEASSHFVFGKWSQKKDTLKFSPADPGKYPFLSSVKTSKTTDEYITVIVYDKKGENITNRIRVGQYVKDVGTYNMDLDSSQTIRRDFKRQNGTLVLPTLQSIFGQKVEIAIDSFNVFEIHLNLSAQWIFRSNSDWNETPVFYLTKNGDKLISTRPDQIDGSGNVKPTVFVRDKR